MTTSLRRFFQLFIILGVLSSVVYFSTWSGMAQATADTLHWQITWDFENDHHAVLKAEVPLTAASSCTYEAPINSCHIVGTVPIHDGKAWFDGLGYIQCTLPTADEIRTQVRDNCQVQLAPVCFVENGMFWMLAEAEPVVTLPLDGSHPLPNPIFTHAHVELDMPPDYLRTIWKFPGPPEVVVEHNLTTPPPPPSPSMPDILTALSPNPPYVFALYDCQRQDGGCYLQQWANSTFLGDGVLPRGVEFFVHFNNTIQIGYSPVEDSYFRGSIDKVIIDPGNFIDHGIIPLSDARYGAGQGERYSFLSGTPRADMNGDGKSDLLWRHAISGTLSVWAMDKATRLNAIPIVSAAWPSSSWQVVGINDFNHDANVDLLWQNDTSGRLAIWLMDNITHTSGLLLDGPLDLNWRVAGTADFNNDGQPDVLWHHSVSGMAAVWFFEGTKPNGTLVALDPPAMDAAWRIAGIGEFNYDDQADILWRHQNSGALVVWLMNGIQRVEERALIPGELADANWQIAALWDVDDNGATDIIWRNQISGRLVLWAMDGTTRLCGRFLMPDMEALNWQVVGPR